MSRSEDLRQRLPSARLGPTTLTAAIVDRQRPQGQGCVVGLHPRKDCHWGKVLERTGQTRSTC